MPGEDLRGDGMMNFFNRFRSAPRKSEAQPEQPESECTHVTLAPRWDNVADIGKEEKAISFTCAACGEEFSPEEAVIVRKKALDVLTK